MEPEPVVEPTPRPRHRAPPAQACAPNAGGGAGRPLRRRRLPRRPMLPPALALCERMLHTIAGAKRSTRAACRGVTLRRYTPESTPAPGGITGRSIPSTAWGRGGHMPQLPHAQKFQREVALLNRARAPPGPEPEPEPAA